MGALTGVVVGFAAAAGILAASRLFRRRDRGEGAEAGRAGDPVLDLERDPASGAYRLKDRDDSRARRNG